MREGERREKVERERQKLENKLGEEIWNEREREGEKREKVEREAAVREEVGEEIWDERERRGEEGKSRKELEKKSPFKKHLNYLS